jgi:hypothetical protein
MAANQAIERLRVAPIEPLPGQGRFGFGVEDVISFYFVHEAPETVLRPGRPAYRVAFGSGFPTKFFPHYLPLDELPCAAKMRT